MKNQMEPVIKIGKENYKIKYVSKLENEKSEIGEFDPVKCEIRILSDTDRGLIKLELMQDILQAILFEQGRRELVNDNSLIVNTSDYLLSIFDQLDEFE